MLRNDWGRVKRTPETAVPYVLLILVVAAAVGWIWRWLSESAYGAAVVLIGATVAASYAGMRYARRARP